MKLYGINVDPVATSWLADSTNHKWLAFGPAAGRAAVPLAIDQSDTVRALNYVAGSRGARAEVLATLSDRWLASDIDRLVESPRQRIGWAARQTVLPPASDPGDGSWNSVWSSEQNVSRMLSAEARDVRQLLPAAAFTPATTPSTAARLAHDIFASRPLSSGWFTPTQTLYATAASAAELEMPASRQMNLPPITREHFESAGLILGAGAAGVVAGGIAAAMGAPAMLSLGLGAAAGGAALWLVSSLLPEIDLREVWDAFTGWVGKVVDGAINFRAPGSGPTDPGLTAAANGTIPAADALGTLVTAKDRSVLETLHRALA